MKRLWKYLSKKQCAAICTATLIVMFGLETAAVHFCEKDTCPFNILMGIVIACPFVFTFFLQGVWREECEKDIDNVCNK